MRTLPIEVPEARIRELCVKHRIRMLSLFGSVLRDDFRPDSDVDILVEFEPGVHIGFFGLSGIQDELSDLLGRSVDLRTVGMFSPRFRQEILSGAEALYVAA